MGISFTDKATYGGEGATAYEQAKAEGMSEREADRRARLAEAEEPMRWERLAYPAAPRAPRRNFVERLLDFLRL